MNKGLNPLLHSELRLAIMSLLISNGDADFMDILEQTNSTSGNLSTQLEKLKIAGYLKIIKSFKNKRPCTNCKITEKGLKEFEEYVQALKKILPNL